MWAMTAYRDDLEALSARHDTLSREVADKTRELERATQLLEDARSRARLPVLDNIRVASPCTADWNAMTGDERVRACGACDKDVYNLSALTRDEAEALIVARNGRLCVRYYQRKDGTILLGDCTVGAGNKRRRRLVAAGAAALLAGGGVLAHHLTASARGTDVVMGAIESPAPEVVPEVAPEVVPEIEVVLGELP